MAYSDVATTVFTPLELGTVGLSEEQAVEAHGAANVDVFASVFAPLEWTLREDRPAGVSCMAKVSRRGTTDLALSPRLSLTLTVPVSCMAKVVVHKGQGGRVLGMHIAAPNAGEIIQGFAVAFRKGTLTHQVLAEP